MTVIYTALIIALVWMVLQLWPVPSLSCLRMNLQDSLMVAPSSIKVLDVRDAVLYDKEHIPDTINISLGRLPFVWNQSLSSGDAVMILADNYCKSKKAARILHRRGFRRLYAVRGPVLKHLSSVHEPLNGDSV
ncbi:rhodanese-like domain-containing protein [Paenibacillus agri]|uniref:rhodanese-like domain-containing protein n=1 Tax=Paenibacillus agri TaxID=2744309 RepID=UPI0035E463DF